MTSNGSTARFCSVPVMLFAFASLLFACDMLAGTELGKEGDNPEGEPRAQVVVHQFSDDTAVNASSNSETFSGTSELISADKYNWGGQEPADMGARDLVLEFDTLTFSFEEGANGYRWGQGADAIGDILNISIEQSEAPLTGIIRSTGSTALSDSCHFNRTGAVNIADATVTLDGNPLSFDDCGLSRNDTFEVFVSWPAPNFGVPDADLGEKSWELKIGLSDDPNKACTPDSCAEKNQHCNASGQCVACTSNDHCTDPALGTCSSVGICVADTSGNCNASCTGDLICKGNECVECTEVGHCGDDDLFECTNNKCEPQPCTGKPPEFQCVDVNQSGACPSNNTISGLCPGGANILCCSPEELPIEDKDRACDNKGGKCQFGPTCNGGKYQPNLCLSNSASDFRCCVPDSGDPGGGTSGTDRACDNKGGKCQFGPTCNGGKYQPNLCLSDNASNYRCCVPDSGDPGGGGGTNATLCTNARPGVIGKCRSEVTNNCDTGFQDRRCPDSGSTIKCCFGTVTRKPTGGSIKTGDPCREVNEHGTTGSGCSGTLLRTCREGYNNTYFWSACQRRPG